MPSPPLLPSWNEGPVRSAIEDFLQAACDPASPRHVTPPERIAVFAHDGTLCSEFPLPVQALFIGARLAELARRWPALADREPFSAFLREDLPRVHGLGWRGIARIGHVTHAGMSIEEYARRATEWLGQAHHPWLGRPVSRCAYAPQRELLACLHAHGFSCFIVTAADTAFVRALAPLAYGVPPQHVLGTHARTRLEPSAGGPMLVKLAHGERSNEREEKVQSISAQIGKRPLFAFGNADRDLAMLRYTLGGEGPRLALLLHHDDGVREFAYDSGFALNPLDEALERAPEFGIGRVSMRDDWRRVFAPAGDDA